MIWILIAVIAVFLICLILLGLAVQELRDQRVLDVAARETIEKDMDAMQAQMNALDRSLVEILRHEDAA